MRGGIPKAALKIFIMNIISILLKKTKVASIADQEKYHNSVEKQSCRFVILFQIFTAAPPLAMGLFDRICSSESRIKFPELYKSSQNAQQFNVKVSYGKLNTVD